MLTVNALYAKLQRDAKSKGSVNGQVWHEADIDKHHLYFADTSFGDGPVFRCDNHGWMMADPSISRSGWAAFTVETQPEDLIVALDLAERATWVYRLKVLDPSAPA